MQQCRASGASACPITIVVTGKLLMEAGSAITAENNADGGSGGAITITVGTDMTMCGQNGSADGLRRARRQSGRADLLATRQSAAADRCRRLHHDHGRGQGDRDGQLLHGRRLDRPTASRPARRSTRPAATGRAGDIRLPPGPPTSPSRARSSRPAAHSAPSYRDRAGRQDLPRLRLRADQPRAG